MKIVIKTPLKLKKIKLSFVKNCVAIYFCVI